MSSGLANVGRYLRRLDRDALAAFVRDLYRARGRRAHVDDGHVIVSDGERSRIVLPVATRRRPRLSSPATERQVDVVVTAGDGTGHGGALATGLGARLETAADVAEMLRFAVDEADARELCREHLGRPPEALRPSRTQRARAAVAASVATVRERLSTAGATVGDGVERADGRAVLAIVALLLGAAVLTTGGGQFDSSDGPPASNLTTDEFGSGDRPTVNAAPDGNAVPVRSDGSVNVPAVASAHRRAASSTTYLLFRTYTGPSTTGNGTETVVQRTMIARGNDTYRVEQQTTTCGSSLTMTYLYYDGSDLFGARYNGTLSYTQLPADAQYPTAPEEAVVGNVERYLSTTNTVVTDPSIDVPGVYVVASGTPTSPSLRGVENYHAEAVVGRDGMVRELTVSYDLPNDSRSVSFSLRYADVGETTVRAPAWYDARWGDGTATATTPATTNATFFDEYGKLRAEMAARKLCRDLADPSAAD
ncbi:hypothetical protein VB773_18060 [Haloarculaceae archaeon H-GB2-1]|nr:hypothetical protein [Haloarculaceae archaeon H-GB1-1]MEA5387792.1 hypothetical protein [Haloarculaceae archaeon H-GB11]MEA5409291.1 hypothetical protein [Haloarculaceae archaeon H-GB2-1]